MEDKIWRDIKRRGWGRMVETVLIIPVKNLSSAQKIMKRLPITVNKFYVGKKAGELVFTEQKFDREKRSR